MDFRLENAEFNVETLITQAKYFRMLRWCEICKRDEDLIDCERCKSVFYCSQEHKISDSDVHNKSCAELCRFHQCDLFLLDLLKLNEHFISVPIPEQNYFISNGISDDLLSWWEFNNNPSPEFSIVSEILTFSFTIIHHIQDTSVKDLNIHVVGASKTETTDAFNLFKYITWIHPRVNLTLIGPELDPNIKDVSHSTKFGTLNLHFISNFYHNAHLSNPQLLIAFHCGIFDEEYTSHWRPTINLIQTKHIPTILTVADEIEMSKTKTLLKEWNVNIKNAYVNRFASNWIQQLPDNRNATFCTNKYIIEL